MSRGLVLVQHRRLTVTLCVEVKVFALLERVHSSLLNKRLLRDNLPEIRLLIRVLTVKLALTMLLVGLLLDQTLVMIHLVHLISHLLAVVCDAIAGLLLDWGRRLFGLLSITVHIGSKFAHVQLDDLVADLSGFVL